MLLAKISIRRVRNIVYADPGNLFIKKGDLVLVQTENDLEYGIILDTEKQMGQKINEFKDKKEKYLIIRKCTKKDLSVINENQKKAKQVKAECLKQIQVKNLDMKLTYLEYTFNKDKLFLYYTAEGRIDFRELIKDLGTTLKTKIQMVQIGVRDETKILGAIGYCGRVLCCRDFLNDFKPIVIDMAKEQNLSLNPTKISGVCGRLLCCLGYEYDYYKEMAQIMPCEGEIVSTKDGDGKVKSRNILKKEVNIIFDDGSNKDYNIDKIKFKMKSQKCSNSCTKCENKDKLGLER